MKDMTLRRVRVGYPEGVACNSMFQKDPMMGKLTVN